MRKFPRILSEFGHVTLLALTFLLLPGCVGTSPGYQRGDYGWGFINRSDQRLTDNMLDFVVGGEKGNVGKGDLSPHQTYMDDRGVYPTPETGTIYWRTPDGQMHEQQVTIRALLPMPDYAPNPKYFKDGTIWFVYDGKQWTVKPMTQEQVMQRIMHSVPNATEPD